MPAFGCAAGAAWFFCWGMVLACVVGREWTHVPRLRVADTRVGGHVVDYGSSLPAMFLMRRDHAESANDEQLR